MENSNSTPEITSNGIEQEPALESTEAGGFEGMRATYSPDDNKLRIYAAARLPSETYARVREAGFVWAAKQGLFVAPMWTPQREDLAIELCGELDDEDTSLVERAGQRAERFEDYSDRRAGEAATAKRHVQQLADGIPFGQPILIGHHSEKQARKDAERIENGMRRAVKLWETSTYWTARAAGAVQHAKYKERPDVRARRIRTIEADLRKVQRTHDQAAKCIGLWESEDLTLAKALAIANVGHVSASFSLAAYPRTLPASQYEGMMSLWSALNDGIATVEQAKELALKTFRASRDWAARWISHHTLRLSYERAMLGEQGGTVSDRIGPELGGAVRCWASPNYGRAWAYIKKVNKVSVTIGEMAAYGGRIFTRTVPFDKLVALMTAAAVEAARESGRLTDIAGGVGFSLAETDTNPPKVEDSAQVVKPAPSGATGDKEDFAQLKEQLRAGVAVAVAPQLFPTPAALAARMVALAKIEGGQTVLEPSAGTGALLRAVCEQTAGGAILTAVEIDCRLASRLQLNYANVHQADFLGCGAELGKFQHVLMNPPFENAVDIKHILHARSMLVPGGQLVAICANGPRQNATLRPLVDACGGLWEPLPSETFKSAGTSVRSVLLTLSGV